MATKEETRDAVRRAINDHALQLALANNMDAAMVMAQVTAVAGGGLGALTLHLSDDQAAETLELAVSRLRDEFERSRAYVRSLRANMTTVPGHG